MQNPSLLKFGVEIKPLFLNQGSSSKGTLSYGSLTNFLNNVMNTASYTALLPLVRQRKTEYFMYAEDEWKVSENFTVSMGVRYNIFNALYADHNDDVPFDFGTCGGFCPNTYAYFHPRYDDVDPRIRLAWSHGNTVFRAGGGIYHTDGQLDDQNLPHLEYGGRLLVQQHELHRPFLSSNSISCFRSISSEPSATWAIRVPTC